jgi:hypothetical protein
MARSSYSLSTRLVHLSALDSINGQAAKITGLPRSVNISNPFLTVISGWPDNVYILRTDSTLKYKDGTTPSGTDVHNHHVMNFDIRGTGNKGPIFKCGGLGVAETTAHGLQIPRGYIGGSSMDGAPALFSSADGKYNSGHHLAKGAKVVFFAELINLSNKPLEVYSVTEVDYIDAGSAGATMMDSSVGIVSVNECSGGIPDPQLDVPQGKKQFSVTGPPITITESGYMVR